jgi:hypothetical protein
VHDVHVYYFDLLDHDVCYSHLDLCHYYWMVVDDYDLNVGTIFYDDFVILIDYVNYVMMLMNEKIENWMNDVLNRNVMNYDCYDDHDYHLN